MAGHSGSGQTLFVTRVAVDCASATKLCIAGFGAFGAPVEPRPTASAAQRPDVAVGPAPEGRDEAEMRLG